MMYKFILAVLFVSAINIIVVFTADAAPYGDGKYNAVVPYGGQTQLSIATTGSISIPITPASGGTLGTGPSVVTVTSTDVVGYKLYIRSVTTTNLVNGAAVLPASSNVTAGTLATNTWGYNTTGLTTFIGLTTSDVLLKSFTGPAETGDVTTVTYGVNIDQSKKAGSYSSDVVYTAVPQTN